METNEILEDYFTNYAAAVAQSRALVSVEDGLKPSLRKGMYANYTDGWVTPKKTGKFLKLIGSASRFCWHGDASTFGLLIRASKPWAMRYPLYEAQGSMGTLMSPDSHAAPRYVEGRIAPLGALLFKNLDKGIIDEWCDNYDNTEKYPISLPSMGFWNLCNGCSGIGIGLSSSIPSMNLREMNTALIAMLWNRSYELPMPDFPTGGILLNSDEVRQALLVGKGAACKIRGRMQYEKKENKIIVTEVPYATYTNTICKELEELEADENSGIDSHNDGTGKNVDIEIYLKKNADPDKVIELLYAKTSLQNTFGINLIMLENGRKPKLYSLPEAMRAHLDYEIKMYTKSYEHDKEIAEKRVHILDGYITACANIEEVIETIKTSKDKADAAKRLVKNFDVDEIQAEAILKLTLARIASLEVQKFIKEREELLKEIEHITQILNTKELLYKEVEKGLQNVMDKFGDDRRTELCNEIVISEKLYYFTKSGKVYLNVPKNEEVLTIYDREDDYLGISKNGTIYRYIGDIIRAKKIFPIKDDDSIIAVYPYKNDFFITLLDNEGHFRCKEVSSLGPKQTSVALSNITYCGYSMERTTKQNYRRLCGVKIKN